MYGICGRNFFFLLCLNKKLIIIIKKRKGCVSFVYVCLDSRRKGKYMLWNSKEVKTAAFQAMLADTHNLSLSLSYILHMH